MLTQAQHKKHTKIRRLENLNWAKKKAHQQHHLKAGVKACRVNSVPCDIFLQFQSTVYKNIQFCHYSQTVFSMFKQLLFCKPSLVYWSPSSTPAVWFQQHLPVPLAKLLSAIKSEPTTKTGGQRAASQPWQFAEFTTMCHPAAGNFSPKTKHKGTPSLHLPLFSIFIPCAQQAP